MQVQPAGIICTRWIIREVPSLHSFTLEPNLSNSMTHSGFSWVTRWAEELKLSSNRNELKPLYEY